MLRSRTATLLTALLLGSLLLACGSDTGPSTAPGGLPDADRDGVAKRRDPVGKRGRAGQTGIGRRRLIASISVSTSSGSVTSAAPMAVSSWSRLVAPKIGAAMKGLVSCQASAI